MTDVTGSAPNLRQQLGAELRRLRDLAGLSGRDLAARIGISQSTLSRIEGGDRAPSLPEVSAWCGAAGADDVIRTHLTQLAEAARTELAPWRVMLTDNRTHLQEAARQLEATAHVVRDCQHTMVPGLLQTAAYAQALFPLVVPTLAEHSTAEAVAARMQRQETLYDPSKQFHFLVGEAALRASPGQRVMPAQLARLESVATLTNVCLGLLPFDASAGFLGSFTIYDDRGDAEPVAAIELPHARVTLDSPADVAVYRETFTRWREKALVGDEATQLLQQVARHYRGSAA